jgi:thioredoxin 1
MGNITQNKQIRESIKKMRSPFLQHWWPTIGFIAILLVITKCFTSPPCSFIPGLCSIGRSLFTSQEQEPMSSDQSADAIEHVTTQNFEDKVLRMKVPVLVDFYATWCRPCRALSPVLAELADEISDAKVVKVNIDENPELTARYGVSSIPNLIVFKNGEPAGRHVGPADKASLKRLLLD